MTQTKQHTCMLGRVMPGMVTVSCPVRKWRKYAVTGPLAALEIKVIADLIVKLMDLSSRMPREGRNGG